MNTVHNYASYLVRLWYEDSDSAGTTIWHSQVESIQSGESWHFNDPGSLMRFLEEHFPQANVAPDRGE